MTELFLDFPLPDQKNFPPCVPFLTCFVANRNGGSLFESSIGSHGIHKESPKKLLSCPATARNVVYGRINSKENKQYSARPETFLSVMGDAAESRKGA